MDAHVLRVLKDDVYPDALDDPPVLAKTSQVDRNQGAEEI